METDPAAESWSSGPAKGERSPSCLEASMPRKFRDGAARRAGTACSLNWAMCALCLASLAVSGVLFYRELSLESRIAGLEARCQRVQESSPDVLVQRLKRELQEQLQQTQRSYGPAEADVLFRPKRDVPECNCPPGESIWEIILLRHLTI